MLDQALHKLPPVVWAWGTILKLPRFEKANPSNSLFCYYSCYYFRSI